ncbi:peptidylprolyl isomerase [Marmoricola sp. RAF53]|uniref:peptidylprolyl isomerase n=1 Tax=Marmoricola sp. RAF53 TaxID=3233059 RepID=UPI003F9C64AF
MIRLRVLALVLLPLLVLAGCGSADDKSSTTADDGPCTYTKSGDAARKVSMPPSTPDPKNPAELTISTSAGDIPVTLEPDTAPCAVNSFVSLADQGFFDDTRCHRLTTNGYYVLQCGDPTGTGSGGPGYVFANELVKNDERLQPCGTQGGQEFCTYNAGVVAMANAGGPASNGSQFFLVYGNSTFPPDYTVLGHMDAAGLKVVKEIGAAGIGQENGMGPGDGAPKNPVTITSVK